MPQLVGYGVYLPRYRIPLSEIHAAWGRSGGRGGEKAVVPPDEDPLTMGVKAARAALAQAGIEGRDLTTVLAASTSTDYAEGALAAPLAYHLGAEGNVFVADFGLSARSVTAAIRTGLAALSEQEGYAVIIASEKLTAEPGSSYELSCSGGAGALLLSSQAGFAEVVGFASHTSGFVGRSRREGRFHGLVDDRFVMQQFLAHAREAVERLLHATGISLEEAAHVVLQAPEGRWAVRALKKLGLPAEKLVSTFPQLGYAGCASPLIDLAWALDKAAPGDLLVAVSFGPGGSDALALRVTKSPPKADVEAQLQRKELVSYPVYLRYQGLLGGERR